MQQSIARPFTAGWLARLCGLVGVALVLGALSWAAYARKAPFGSADRLFWAVPVVLVACKIWAAILIGRVLLAHGERGNRRVGIAEQRDGEQGSERAGQATGYQPGGPLIEDHSR